MCVVTNGPIYNGFKKRLKSSGQAMDAATEECSAGVVKLLEHHQTTTNRPGMLLGKVQSGKTRAFVGAIAIAFDSGFDIAIVLTKTSKPLAVQTKRRLENDLFDSVNANRVIIYDAAIPIRPLNNWQQNKKLIFVAKKHPKNLTNLHKVLLMDNPQLRNKRVIIVDDEADFASVGYEKRKGLVSVRRIQGLINQLREEINEVVYLEVTATPYALYLQPADIKEPSTGKFFESIRPAFTKRVPIHSGYVGGDFYFDEAQETGSIASFVHVTVPESQLSSMGQPAPHVPAALLTHSDYESLRRAIITFIVGGVILRHGSTDAVEPERLFSFIVHLERSKDSHTNQQIRAEALIEELQSTDKATGPVFEQIRAAYKDLVKSRDAANITTPPLNQLLHSVNDAFESVHTEVVNSDSDLEKILDVDTGQLRQQSPFNIYIGGQSLDRGVTIANVIGFFYGRSPLVSQQDTTIQHCRMYGNRPRADLTVTRFYTSARIYSRMRTMHEFDKLLWAQLRTRDEDGNKVVEPADNIFQMRQKGEISPCSPSKIKLSRIQTLWPNGELVPYPFTTVGGAGYNQRLEKVISELQTFAKPKSVFELTVAQAGHLLDSVCSLIRIDDDWDWDTKVLKDAVEYLANSHADESMKDRVVALYGMDYTIRKWATNDNENPQRAPYTRDTEKDLRIAAGKCPALAFYHNRGLVDRGWNGLAFIWPVLFVPSGIRPVIFSNNTRSVTE